MPKDFPRALRVGEQIRREIAELLRTEIKDPRVTGFSISEVVVSGDLSRAKVFYAPTLNHENLAELQKGLDSSAPFLRKQLGKILHIRAIPQLTFLYDDSMERYSRMDSLLSKELPDQD